jgi:hypothetical protein
MPEKSPGLSDAASRSAADATRRDDHEGKEWAMNPSDAAGIEPPPVTQPIDMSWLLEDSAPGTDSHLHESPQR